MHVNNPVWHLIDKDRFCDCGPDECLRFLKCPSCNQVVLQCDNFGYVFPNPWSGRRVEGDQFVCETCKGHPIDDFVNATWEEIQNLGFSKADYC